VVPWQYDVSTIATCEGPFPVNCTSAGVIKQLKYFGAFDVHANPTVVGAELDSVNPTTIFPPGVVVVEVEYPGPGANVNVEMLKVAVTDSAALIVTTQLPVPLHAPLHPANADPEAGVAVSVTTVPLT
jgi:hypothetical protein